MNIKESYEKFLKDIEEIPAEEKARMTAQEIKIRETVMEFSRKMVHQDCPFFLIFEKEPIYGLTQWQRVLWNEDGESNEAGKDFAANHLAQVCLSFYIFLKMNLQAIGLDKPTHGDITDFFNSNVLEAAEFVQEINS